MAATPATIFRATLAIPLVLPFVLLPLANSTTPFAALGFLALAFGGLQYLVFAVVMFIWIGRLRNDTGAIQKLSLFSPLIFVPIQAAGVLLYATVQWVREPSFEWLSVLQGIPVFAGYCLVIGYAYVVVANIIFGICSITGLVREGT